MNTRHKHTLHKNAGAALSMSNTVCPAAEGRVSNKVYCMLEEVDTQYQVCLCVHCKGHICLNKQSSLVESLDTTFHDLTVTHNSQIHSHVFCMETDQADRHIQVNSKPEDDF